MKIPFSSSPNVYWILFNLDLSDADIRPDTDSVASSYVVSVVTYPFPSTNAATAADVGRFADLLSSSIVESTCLIAASPTTIEPVLADVSSVTSPADVEYLTVYR